MANNEYCPNAEYDESGQKVNVPKVAGILACRCSVGYHARKEGMGVGDAVFKASPPPTEAIVLGNSSFALAAAQEIVDNAHTAVVFVGVQGGLNG